MFWSFITWAGQDPLVLIEGNLNGKRYADLLGEWIRIAWRILTSYTRIKLMITLVHLLLK